MSTPTYEDKVRAKAAVIEPRPLCWVHGADEGISYCDRCVDDAANEAKQTSTEPDEIEADGGWNTESDGQEFCHKCGAVLDSSYTDYGVQAELEGLEQEASGSATDCYIAVQLLDYHRDEIPEERMNAVLESLVSEAKTVMEEKKNGS